jgi:hypothetical protein
MSDEWTENAKFLNILSSGTVFVKLSAELQMTKLQMRMLVLPPRPVLAFEVQWGRNIRMTE